MDRAIEMVNRIPDNEFHREDLLLALDRACSERRGLPPQLDPELFENTKAIRQLFN